MEMIELLKKGLLAQNIAVPDQHQKKLIELVNLLDKWNKVYNLTAVREKKQMVTRHILDSLSTTDFINDVNNIVDVGSGGGFPGLPLAICDENKSFTLIDCNIKKTRFLVHAKTLLNLENVSVIHQRVEKIEVQEPFDCLIARAFASPSDVISLSSHLLSEKAKLVLMMGHVDKQKLQNLPGFKLKEVVPVQIFNEQSERHVVTFTKSS